MLPMLRGVTAVIGRLFLTAIFLMSALGNKIPNFDAVAGVMAGAGIPAPRLMLVGAIVFLIVGSLSVLLGFRPRIGAALLLVFLILATYYFHAPWRETDPKAQQDAMIQLLKNLGLMGAMLLIIADGLVSWTLDGLLKSEKPGGPTT